MTRHVRVWLAVPMILGLVFVTASCGTTTRAGSARRSRTSRSRLTDSAPAGEVTFDVTNDAEQTDEFVVFKTDLAADAAADGRERRRRRGGRRRHARRRDRGHRGRHHRVAYGEPGRGQLRLDLQPPRPLPPGDARLASRCRSEQLATVVVRATIGGGRNPPASRRRPITSSAALIHRDGEHVGADRDTPRLPAWSLRPRGTGSPPVDRRPRRPRDRPHVGRTVRPPRIARPHLGRELGVDLRHRPDLRSSTQISLSVPRPMIGPMPPGSRSARPPPGATPGRPWISSLGDDVGDP